MSGHVKTSPATRRAWPCASVVGAALLPALGAVALGVALWYSGTEHPKVTPIWMCSLWAVACLAGALACGWALRRPKGEVFWVTLLLAAALRAAVLPMGTTLSSDFHRYLWDGREVVAGRSPYAATPDEVAAAVGPRAHDEPLLQGMNSSHLRSVYPAASQAAFAAAWATAGGTEAGAVRRATVALRAVFAAVDLAAVAAMMWLLIRWGRHPGWAILYAWHPMPVVEAIGGVHTEALLALPLVLAVAWALPPVAMRPRTVEENARPASRSAGGSRAWPRLAGGAAGVAIAVAAAVKLFPLAAVAVLAGVLRGPRRWALVAATFVAATVLLFPLLGPPHGAGVRDSLALYGGHFRFNSPQEEWLHRGLVALGVEADAAAAHASTLLRGLFVLGSGVAVVFAWGRGTPRVGPALLAVVFGLYLACSAAVHPWYPLWVLWLVPLTPVARPAILWLAATVPLSHLAYDPAWSAGGVPGWAMAAQWLPAAGLLLAFEGRRLAMARPRSRVFSA